MIWISSTNIDEIFENMYLNEFLVWKQMTKHANCENSITTAGVIVKIVFAPVMADILAAILDLYESSRIIAPHPLDFFYQDYHIYQEMQ